jgi:transcriptional regulator with XRE-family HTH domain
LKLGSDEHLLLMIKGGRNMATFRGDKLREAREQAELSRLQLASVVDVTQSTVEAWESGKQSPSGQLLADLADAVGLDLTELFEKDQPAEGSYRSHSRIGGSTYKQPGQAQEEAELAKLQGDLEEARSAYNRAYKQLRAADSWDNAREMARVQATGDRLAALEVKLKAYERTQT